MSNRKQSEGSRMDPLHRILTGQTLSRKELVVGGTIVGIWFVMDLIQWVDWLISKFK